MIDSIEKQARDNSALLNSFRSGPQNAPNYAS